MENLIHKYDEDLSFINNSPELSLMKLNRIQNDLIDLKANLIHYRSNNKHTGVNNQLNSLQFKLDKLKYENSIIPKEDPSDDDKDSSYIENMDHSSTDEETNITSLRKRLLNNDSLYLKEEQLNTYHENFQSELINDLTNLAQDLKSGAYNLSKKIFDDSTVLDRAGENFETNSTLLNNVSLNLNNYVTNKSGGKISLWFLLKVIVGMSLTFLLMVLLIKILPSM